MSYRRFSCYHSKLFVVRLNVNLYGQALLPTVSSDGQVELCSQPTANHHIELHLPMNPVARHVQQCLRLFGYGVVDRVMYGDSAPLFQVDTVQNFNRDTLKGLMKLLPHVERKLETAFKALVAQSGEVEMDLEVTTQLCLICPDTTDKDASILDVCDDNVAEYFEWWQKSIISQFHHSPKIVPPKLNKNASASAQVHMEEELPLPVLVTELRNVVDWVLFGIALNIDYSKLKEIQKDRVEVGPCKIEMLHVWKEMKRGSWADIVQALQHINKNTLAKEIAEKYGVPILPQSTKKRRRSLTDIITENGNQLEPDDMLVLKKLDEAARKEEEKLAKNDTQIQHLEHHLRRSSGRVKHMSVKLQELKNEIEMKEREKEELQQRVEQMEHKIHELRNSEILLKESLEEATQQQEDMQREISAKEKELVDTMHKLTENEKELSQQRLEKERLVWRLQQANKEVSEKKAEIIQLKEDGRINMEEFKHTMSKIETVLERVNPEDISSNKSSEHCRRRQDEVDEYKERLAEKEQKISELSQKITELEHQIFALQTMRSETDYGSSDGATSISGKFTRSLDRLGKRAWNKALRNKHTPVALVASAIKKCESNTLSKEEEAEPLIAPPNLCREESIQPDIDHDLVTKIIQKHWTHEVSSPHHSPNGRDTPTPPDTKQKPRPTGILVRRRNRRKREQAASPAETPSFQTLPTELNFNLNDSCRSGPMTPLPIPLQLPLPSSYILRHQPIAAWKKLTRVLSKASRIGRKKNYENM